MKRSLLLLAFVMLPVWSRPDFGKVDHEAQKASLVSLIATPDRFHGKVVRVEGPFRVEFEGNVICLHTEDLRNYISKNCVWLHIDFEALGSTPKSLSKHNGKHVLLEGTFNKEDNGHRDCCSGSIEHVSRVMIIEPLGKP